MYGTAFFVRNGDRYFINNDRGELVVAKLSPAGIRGDQPHQADRADASVRAPARELPNVLWSHAAYANRHIVIRNDHEIVRLSREPAVKLASGCSRVGARALSSCCC